MVRILIADDNKQIQSILKDYIIHAGMEVDIASDGEEAISLFESIHFDLVLLDVMMPKLDGFEVCRTIRSKSTTPIIMITARGEDFEKIMGLDIGADDYIVKPFSPGEVIARIRALLRRVDGSNNSSDTLFICNNITIDMKCFLVKINDVAISLTKKEVEILWFLATHRGQVFTREQLLDQLWGYDYYGDSRTVDTHIKRLRSKLAIEQHSQWDIVTVWGVGYKFEEYNYEI